MKKGGGEHIIYIDIFIFLGISVIHYEKLAHVIIYAENSHNLQAEEPAKPLVSFSPSQSPEK